MKKWFGMLLIALVPLNAAASVYNVPAALKPDLGRIPAQFSSSSKTAVFEWGCPVSEVVKAPSRAEAMRQINASCREEVNRAAQGKPGVFDVIQTSVIYPDLEVSEGKEGYYLKGTIFFETLVLQGNLE